MDELNNRLDWSEHWWPAPAKLNLMLNITGQRADGYHELQTVFQLLNVSDWINFSNRADDQIVFRCDVQNIATDDNLVVRAANLLREEVGASCGAKIMLRKTLPMGAGLGGGSSDAATTLLVLNKMWGLRCSLDDLAALGLQLGADVPVFIRGFSAWAEGVGEVIDKIELPEKWFVVVNSDYHCSTKEVFQNKCLTRDSSAITIRAFLDGYENNDCLSVVRGMSRELDDLYRRFSDFGKVLLTGTGSSMFIKCDTREDAVNLSKELPVEWQVWVVKGVNESPLHSSLNRFINSANKV